MSLLEKAIAARKTLTATLVSPGAESRPQLSATQARERLFGHVYKNDPDWPTIEQVRDVADRVHNELGEQELTWFFQRLGYSEPRCGELWPGLYPRFIAEGTAMCQLKGSFANPYRWLLHHEGSDTLFIEEDPARVVEILNVELDVTDVTQVPFFEQRYIEQLTGL